MFRLMTVWRICMFILFLAHFFIFYYLLFIFLYFHHPFAGPRQVPPEAIHPLAPCPPFDTRLLESMCAVEISEMAEKM